MNGSHYFKFSSSQIIELYFDKIPSFSIRQELKQNYWRWNPDKKCWYAKLSIQNENIAKKFGATDSTVQKKTSVYEQKEPSVNEKVLSFLKDLDFKNMNQKQLEKYLPDLDGPTPKAVAGFNVESQDKQMVVMLCLLSGNFVNIGITQDVSIQNSSKNIYWIERSISKKIINGIINKKPWVLYNGEPCLIFSYSDTDFFRNIIKHSSYFYDSPLPAKIWIYSMKMPCYNHPKAVESVTAYVPVSEKKQLYQINVQYCPICNKYYINSEQHRSFSHKYGLPMVRLMCDNSERISVDFSQWKEESILHSMGYNVSEKDNLSDEERRKKLLHAIKTKTLTKTEVISFLEFLKYRNEGKRYFENACAKWEDDARFIRNYNMENQKIIFGEFQKR